MFDKTLAQIEDLRLMCYFIIILLETVVNVYMLLLALNAYWEQIIAQHIGANLAVVQLESSSYSILCHMTTFVSLETRS